MITRKTLLFAALANLAAFAQAPDAIYYNSAIITMSSARPTAQAVAIRDIGRDLELPIEVFNPLKSVTLGGDLRRELPNQPSRFAPLIGMLLHEASAGEGIIDFLNPRKRPEKKSRKREFIAIGAAVATRPVPIAHTGS